MIKKSINMDDFKEFNINNVKSTEHFSALLKQLPEKLKSLGYQHGRGMVEFFELSMDVMDKICRKMLIEGGLDPELKTDSDGRVYFESLDSEGKLYFDNSKH